MGLDNTHKKSSNDVENDKLYITVFKLILKCLESKNCFDSANTLSTELVNFVNCERVSIGLYQKNEVNLISVSNIIDLKKEIKEQLIISNAMEEAIEQQLAIHYPSDENKFIVTLSHQALSEDLFSTILTIPLVSDDIIIGAFCFEKKSSSEFSQQEIRLCKTISVFMGPIIEQKRKNSLPLLKKMSEHFMQLGFLKENILMKSFFLFMLAIFISLFFINGNYYISANALLVGKIQRSIVAPYDGYLESVYFIPGDKVKAGEVIGTLNTDEYIQEKLSLQNEVKKYQNQYRQALGKQERYKTRIIQTKIDQAKAKVNLIDLKLEKMSLTSPFDGVITEGDLRDLVGSPVEKGQLLYILSPEDQYRVTLEVNEEFINDISISQQGKLQILGTTEKTYEIQINNVFPVAITKDKNNHFKVEASFISSCKNLLPGMNGQAKILVGSKSLMWIWTRKTTIWFKTNIWRYLL